ncbi:MAG: hypothetical protein AAFQ98_12390 [Bacteroidota bacterium]
MKDNLAKRRIRAGFSFFDAYLREGANLFIMHRIGLFSLVFTGFVFTAFGQLAQQGSVTPLAPGTSQDLNQYLNEYYGRNDEESGSRRFEDQTFLHEEWKEYVLVVTFEKDPISIDEAKYDSFSKEIAFQWEGETKYLTQEYVKAFAIQGETEGEERVFINPKYNNLLNSESLSMFEVLADGDISLYKETQHHLQEATGRYDPTSGGTEQNDRLVTEERYYLGKGSNLYPVQPRSRFGRLLSTLTDDEFDAKRFAKEARLRVNRVSDWPAIVMASNEQN